VLKLRWIYLIFVLAIMLGACGAPPPPPETESVPELPPEDPQIAPTESTPENPLQLGRTPEPTEMSSTPPAEKFVQLAKQDLASRLRIDVSTITLAKTAEMEWLNSALGCPRPGVFYPTGRVPGFQIWLDVDGTEYIYNTDLNGALILCPELNPHAPNVDSGPTPGVPIR
jgi:hypothetical protein